jgi:hypothetical protein
MVESESDHAERRCAAAALDGYALGQAELAVDNQPGAVVDPKGRRAGHKSIVDGGLDRLIFPPSIADENWMMSLPVPPLLWLTQPRSNMT